MDLALLKRIAKYDWRLWIRMRLLNRICAKEFDPATEEFERLFIIRSVDRSIVYTLSGRKCRFRGPALISPLNDIYYFCNNKLHRTGAPAHITLNENYFEKCIDDPNFELELDKLPRYAYEYYENGKLHRTDGPAVRIGNKKIYYYRNGKLHRWFAPAIVHDNEYYLYGRNLRGVFGPVATKPGIIITVLASIYYPFNTFSIVGLSILNRNIIKYQGWIVAISINVFAGFGIAYVKKYYGNSLL